MVAMAIGPSKELLISGKNNRMIMQLHRGTLPYARNTAWQWKLRQSGGARQRRRHAVHYLTLQNKNAAAS